MFLQLEHQFPQLRQYWEKYLQLRKRVNIPAHTILLNAGEVSQTYWFVEKGCLRAWFDKQGNDTTLQFFFENEWLKSSESFAKAIPSKFTIETIEPSILHVLNRQDYELLLHNLNQDEDYRKQLSEMTQQRLFHYIDELTSRLEYSPKDRYLNLLEHQPHLITRIPHRFLASYLGITRVHLSRIKSQLLKNK